MVKVDGSEDQAAQESGLTELWNRVVPGIPNDAVRAVAQRATPLAIVCDTVLVAIPAQDRPTLDAEVGTVENLLTTELGRPVRLAVMADPDE
ncbi:hypothetical protein ACFRKB_32190 [Streptomyces scopuliridis]|uniref:hypothetical protein n=1 Tax=Streptomyces scopuliridis TaxID=452529 RepID=UPI0036AAB72C